MYWVIYPVSTDMTQTVNEKPFNIEQGPCYVKEGEY